MGITERAAYLKGLAEGMELDRTKKEGKLLWEAIGVLEEAAAEIAALRREQGDLTERLDALSDGFADME